MTELTPNERKVLESLGTHGGWLTMESLRLRNLYRFAPWTVTLMNRQAMSLYRRELVYRRDCTGRVQYRINTAGRSLLRSAV